MKQGHGRVQNRAGGRVKLYFRLMVSEGLDVSAGQGMQEWPNKHQKLGEPGILEQSFSLESEEAHPADTLILHF